MHRCLEQYCKGEISQNDLVKAYEGQWGQYVLNDLEDKNGFIQLEKEDEYYQIGINYLSKKIELPNILERYEILGVEKRVEFKIGEYPMVGFIDLLLKEKATGEILIMDHKSAKIQFKKNGDPYKSDEDHWRDFKRQLYLYAIPVIKEYGNVKALAWNLFRMGIVKKIEFDDEEFREAKQWALDTIHRIERDTEFNQRQDYFYCRNLCGQRNNCNQEDSYMRNYDYGYNDEYVESEEDYDLNWGEIEI